MQLLENRPEAGRKTKEYRSEWSSPFLFRCRDAKTEGTGYFPLRTISFMVNIPGDSGWFTRISSAVQTLARLLL